MSGWCPRRTLPWYSGAGKDFDMRGRGRGGCWRGANPLPYLLVKESLVIGLDKTSIAQGIPYMIQNIILWRVIKPWYDERQLEVRSNAAMLPSIFHRLHDVPSCPILFPLNPGMSCQYVCVHSIHHAASQLDPESAVNMKSCHVQLTVTLSPTGAGEPILHLVLCEHHSTSGLMC